MNPILKLEKGDEEKEIRFELDYLQSLSYNERLGMMLKSSRRIMGMLIKNGYRKPFEIIKRK